MSIYATLSEIGIKRFGDKQFIDILVQGVPAHIDHVGQAWDFLPPPVDPEGTVMRAVFFVEAGDDKGTDGVGHHYERLRGPVAVINWLQQLIFIRDGT